MSRGIWATWYDVADADRDVFAEWERTVYLPALAAEPGYNWVARYASKSGEGIETGVFGETVVDAAKEGIGSASEYLVLVGADSPHRFLNPLVLDRNDAPYPSASEMLGKRINARHAVLLEEESVIGPDAPPEGPDVPALAIRCGNFSMRTPQEDFDAGRWYAQRRLAEMAASPGCVRTRKLMCVAGWGKHCILYEFTSPEARADLWKGFQEQRRTDPATFWTIGPQTLHAPGSPFLGQRTWSSV
ncbi:hypothetical protein ACSBOB_32960 [Mesorhizobium sp. ASY16-5R]|uniref:hypothetical protein n=1 Tax=Mesorhizobium sp. ASY16-5R TaxID=3445772 RepID=UPI003FA025A7